MDRVFDRLYGMLPETDDHGEAVPRLCHLTDEAKALFVAFVNENGEERAALTGTLAATWAKLEAYCGRLALLDHLAGVAAGEALQPDWIEAGSVRAAVGLVRWFGGEARRIHAAMGESDEARERRRLVEWIGAKGGAVTIRDMMRGLRAYRKEKDATAALDALGAGGAGRWAYRPVGPKGGQQERLFVLGDGGDATTVFDRASRGSVSVATSPGCDGECADGEGQGGWNVQTDNPSDGFHGSEGASLNNGATGDTDGTPRHDSGNAGTVASDTDGDGLPLNAAYADACGAESAGQEGGGA